MAKSFKATWLGDSDPAAQMIRMGDLTFIKGEAVNVPENHDMADAINGNPTFAIDDTSAKPVDADEHPPVDMDEGTEKGALKDAIVAHGGDRPKGNPSVESLRKKLAEMQ